MYACYVFIPISYVFNLSYQLFVIGFTAITVLVILVIFRNFRLFSDFSDFSNFHDFSNVVADQPISR
jgi:tellurite resistance protein TehA-like permease